MYKKKGWMLWEILLGVLLVLILIAAVAPKSSNIFNLGKEAKARGDTATIGSAIAEYNVEIGKYPNSLNDLTRKVGQYGPWVSKIEKDPWGNTYIYIKNDDGFVVFSYGPNCVNDGSQVGTIAKGDIGFFGK